MSYLRTNSNFLLTNFQGALRMVLGRTYRQVIQCNEPIGRPVFNVQPVE